MEIFIGNLSPDASPEDLYEFFRPHDEGADVKVVERQLEDGNVIVYGHATIADDAIATRAIEALNGQPILGTEVLVRQFHKRDANEVVPQEIRERRHTSVYTLEARRMRKEPVE